MQTRYIQTPKTMAVNLKQTYCKEGLPLGYAYSSAGIWVCQVYDTRKGGSIVRHFLVFILAALFATGCGGPAPALTLTPTAMLTPSTTPTPTSTATEAPSPTPIPTSTRIPSPTSTAIPLRVVGWEDVPIRTLCLKVDQTFDRIKTPFALPIGEFLSRVLPASGLRVVESSCDATLRITVNGTPLSDYYAFRGGGGRTECFMGAQVTGTVTLTYPQRPPLTLPVNGEFPIPSRIDVCSETPESAPWGNAWIGEVFGRLYEVWGIRILLNAQLDPDENVRKGANLAMGKLGEAGAKDTVPALTRILVQDRNSDVRKSAAEALEMIGPAARQAVPNLIVILRYDRDVNGAAAVRALRTITKKDFGTNADAWEDWWNTQK
jgi:HEAT repeat protein